MATLTQPLPTGAVYTNEPLFPLTVDQYHELIRSGKLTDADPVELLEGILVFKMPKNAPHATSNALVRREIEPKLPAGWHYRSQEPITLTDGEPEPDGAVVRGRIEDYAMRHPAGEDVALVIEVADSSLDRDRGIKLRSYARAGIAQYWIINLIDRQIETYTEPDPVAARPTYLRQSVFSVTAMVPLTLAGSEVAAVNPALLFPSGTHD